jgi:hypothetical protein
MGLKQVSYRLPLPLQINTVSLDTTPYLPGIIKMLYERQKMFCLGPA